MENLEKKNRIQTTSFSLHVMAMAFMLFDHLWATFMTNQEWMTCIGRVAYPIFAFMIVEGYFHTSNLKAYVKRLFLFALLSEIPFNLVMGSRLFFPIHQNVLFTFLIGIGLIWLNEKACKKEKLWISILTGVGTIVLGTVLGIVTFVDFYNGGVMMILVFYFFRGRKWWCYVGQLAAMYYINWELISGLSYELELFGEPFFFVRQGFALLALIPIWLYRGEQGYHSKGFKYFCYSFYPVHLLVLGILMMLV